MTDHIISNNTELHVCQRAQWFYRTPLLFFCQFAFIVVKGNRWVGIFSWSLRSNLAFSKSLASSSEAEDAEIGRADGQGIGTIGCGAGNGPPKFSTSSKLFWGSGKCRPGLRSSSISLLSSWSKNCFISNTCFSTCKYTEKINNRINVQNY